MKIPFLGNKDNKQEKDDNLQNDIIKDGIVDCINEIVIKGNVDCENEVVVKEDKCQGQEPNCNEMNEQLNEVEADKLDNPQGQANEISEIRDEMKKMSQCLENVIEVNARLNKKMLIQESKFIQNIEELKRIIVEEKNEEILELKREIKSKENKEKEEAKNIIKIADQLDAIYNHAVESGNGQLMENLNLTMKIVKKELREIGIEEIPALGEQISTKYHVCEKVLIDDTKSSNEIVEVIQKGYMKNRNVIRESKVAAYK